MKTFLLAFAIILSLPLLAQKADTVRIDASKVNTAVLRPGIHQYLVYMKNGTDSSRVAYQLWTREIELTDYQGRKAIRIKQVWEDNKAVVHKVNSVNDRKDFSPLYQESWWKDRGTTVFDFMKKTAMVNGKQVTDADTARALRGMYGGFKKSFDQYVLNWHLDLETFPLLPYSKGVTFMINFYDPGFRAPLWEAYTVKGSGTLDYNGQPVECWLLYHESKFGKETFWVSKKSKEVLKLEQQSGARLRYKVKLPFVAP